MGGREIRDEGGRDRKDREERRIGRGTGQVRS